MFGPTDAIARGSPAEGLDDEGLVDARCVDPSLAFDMRYATAANIAHRRLYPVARCLLRRPVAEQLRCAHAVVRRRHPGLRLLVKDCYRPRSVQRALFLAVQNTPHQGYVANPKGPTGGVHTYGAAVDVTLADANGRELDMGTPYDAFGPMAQPRHEAALLQQHRLTEAHIWRRHILRDAMQAAQFRTIRLEWWHFDALQGAALRRRWRRLDVSLAQGPLRCPAIVD